MVYFPGREGVNAWLSTQSYRMVFDKENNLLNMKGRKRTIVTITSTFESLLECDNVLPNIIPQNLIATIEV